MLSQTFLWFISNHKVDTKQINSANPATPTPTPPPWLGSQTHYALHWLHNERDGVSNHWPHDCLLNSLFRRRSRKYQSSASLAFVRGIHRSPVNSPHKRPVTRKMGHLMTSSCCEISSSRRGCFTWAGLLVRDKARYCRSLWCTTNGALNLGPCD